MILPANTASPGCHRFRSGRRRFDCTVDRPVQSDVAEIGGVAVQLPVADETRFDVGLGDAEQDEAHSQGGYHMNDSLSTYVVSP